MNSNLYKIVALAIVAGVAKSIFQGPVTNNDYYNIPETPKDDA